MSVLVEIEGNKIPSFQGIGVDNTQSNSASEEFDGIVGLSPEKSEPTRDLLLEELYDNGLITDLMFSIKFENQYGSTYIYFGGYEQEIIETSLNYIPVVQDGFWSVYFEYVQLEGSSQIYESFSTATLDTGTTLTYLSYNAFLDLAYDFESRFGCESSYDLI